MRTGLRDLSGQMGQLGSGQDKPQELPDGLQAHHPVLEARDALPNPHRARVLHRLAVKGVHGTRVELAGHMAHQIVGDASRA